MRMKLLELQNNDKKTKKLRSKRFSDGWEDSKKVFYYQSLPYILKIICSELRSRHHDDFLVSHFGIEKTWELIVRKYYWLMLQRDVEVYIKGYNVYLALKAVCHKFYGDLQSLLVSTHRWKDLSMDFVINLLVSTN